MGSIKKQRKKYQPPTHPWKRAKLETESRLVKDFGFKSKKEIWKSEYFLKRVKRQAKKLIASTTKQSELERLQLTGKLMKYGLANEDTKPEELLNITSNDIMNRRLQTVILKNNLARSINQARQFIVHGHIMVNNKKITSPSYLVLKNEEDKIIFDPASSFSNPEHPERIIKGAKKKTQEDKTGHENRKHGFNRRPITVKKRNK